MPLLFAILLSVVTAFPPAHKFHVTYSRIAVEGTTAVARVRFFKDDLDKSLANITQNPTYSMDVSQKQDSLFLAYFNTRFTISDGNEALKGALIGSGEELEGAEKMWWVLIQYDAAAPIQKLDIVNKLLIETFEDQKNIVQIQQFPSEKTWSLYFVEDDLEYSLQLDQ
ncbi:hypothetical protein HQ496_09160 [bacterium]|nr:hypothetical protein [bacterium]